MRHDLQGFSHKEVCLAHTVGKKTAKLMRGLSYVDKDGVRYCSPARMTTDGFSIPRAFWRVIGPPYASEYLIAAVIHDQGCNYAHELNKTNHEEAVKYRKEIDELFREMLIFLGCNRFKAWLMYRGVRIGARSMKPIKKA